MSEFKKAEEIVEGVDLNRDLLQIFGYLVALGWQEKVFPTEHLNEIHQRFMDLYKNQSVGRIEQLEAENKLLVEVKNQGVLNEQI